MRTRVYADNAARQRAYRKRKKSKKEQELDEQHDTAVELDARHDPVETTVERATRMGNDALAQFFGKAKGTS